MGLSLILQKVAFLHAAVNPDFVDGNPGQPGPIFRGAMADFVVAELLRDISQLTRTKDSAATIRSIGKELAAGASGGLVTAWDEGDELCPPYPFPFPHRGPDPGPSSLVFGPHPEPWRVEHVGPAMTDIVLAHALRQLASLTTSEKASKAIQEAGQSMVKAASSQLFDEYCATPVKPRPHAQVKQATTAA